MVKPGVRFGVPVAVGGGRAVAAELPRRWVAERTFGWLARCGRLPHDYERKTAHAEARIQFAMIRLMAARLADEHIEPRGPIETEAARRLAEDLKD
ncbi:hypothetical protein GCM10009565_37520 [Amycolatopsis albidoflavus]